MELETYHELDIHEEEYFLSVIERRVQSEVNDHGNSKDQGRLYDRR